MEIFKDFLTAKIFIDFQDISWIFELYKINDNTMQLIDVHFAFNYFNNISFI